MGFDENNIYRRDFILLSLSLGLSTLLSPYAVASNLKTLGVDPGEYEGPLIRKFEALLGRLDRKEITPEDFVIELRKHYAEIDLNTEFGEWINGPHEKNEIKSLFMRKSADHKRDMSLFFIDSNCAHPPHAHHNVMSTQCVLKGNIHLRQFDRVKRFDDKHLGIKLTNDAVLSVGNYILMTEYQNNIHWFKSVGGPSVILNYRVTNLPYDTFDPKSSRRSARYYIDPTPREVSEGLIVAPEISQELAEMRFSRRLVSDQGSIL